MDTSDLPLLICECGASFRRRSRKGPTPRYCDACLEERRRRHGASQRQRGAQLEGHVNCGRCKRILPVEMFSPTARRNGSWCRDCAKAAYIEAAGGVTVIHCETCNRAMTITARGAKRKRFCSVKCKNDAKEVRRKAALAEAKAGRVCQRPGCDNPVTGRVGAKWCSERCAQIASHERNPALRLRARAKAFGITVEEYTRLKALPCDICGTHESQDGRALHIDHCHTTNKVRGILCTNCNKMLGLVGDDPERLRAAARYLERNH